MNTRKAKASENSRGPLKSFSPDFVSSQSRAFLIFFFARNFFYFYLSCSAEFTSVSQKKEKI